MSAAATRLDGESCGVGWFTVPSESHPGESWSVRYQGPALMHCFCPAFGRTQTCKHCAAVALAVEVEARQAVTPERRQQAAARLHEIEEMFA